VPRITLPSGRPAEIARSGGDITGGLVVFPDIMGLRPLFDDLVADLAEEHGWNVIAVEPFFGLEELTLEERLASVGRLDDEAMLADLVDAADVLDVEPVGVLGFCMGGMFTLKAAGTGRFHRAVAFYGMIHLPERWQSPTLGDPLEFVRRAEACPVMAIIGTEDQWTPPADVAELEAAGATVVRYEGRDHGFVHDPSRPVHHADDAADAWQRALAFLREP
jgi:carboxymethylenebutenolidase